VPTTYVRVLGFRKLVARARLNPSPQPRVYRWLFPEPECGAVVAAALSEPAASRWPGGGSGAHHVRARAWLSQTRSTSSTKSVSTAAGVSLAVSRAGVRRRRCCGLVGAGSAALAGWRFRCPPRTSSSLCDCIRLASLCACAASPPRERARITNHASSTYAYPYPVLMSTHRRSGGGSADRAVCSGWCSSVCYLFPSLLEPNAYKAKAKTRRDDSFMELAEAVLEGRHLYGKTRQLRRGRLSALAVSVGIRDRSSALRSAIPPLPFRSE
jgi:hypothetical protein